MSRATWTVVWCHWPYSTISLKLTTIPRVLCEQFVNSTFPLDNCIRNDKNKAMNFLTYYIATSNSSFTRYVKERYLTTPRPYTILFTHLPVSCVLYRTHPSPIVQTITSKMWTRQLYKTLQPTASTPQKLSPETM